MTPPKKKENEQNYGLIINKRSFEWPTIIKIYSKYLVKGKIQIKNEIAHSPIRLLQLLKEIYLFAGKISIHTEKNTSVRNVKLYNLFLEENLLTSIKIRNVLTIWISPLVRTLSYRNKTIST